MHPDLTALATQQTQLAEDVTGGHISHDDAVAALDGQFVSDPRGGTWQVTLEGTWLYSDSLGEPSRPADPSSYGGRKIAQAAPAPAPLNFPPPQQAPVTVSDPFNPFAGDQSPFPAESPSTPAWEQPQAATWPMEPELIARPTLQPEPPKSRQTRKSRAKDLGQPATPTKALQVAKMLLAKVKQNLAFSVLAFTAVALFAVLVFTKGEDAPNTTPKATESSSPQNPAPAPSAPADANPTPTTTPAGADVSRVLNTLTSGSVEDVAKVLPKGTSAATTATATALYAGFQPAGMIVETPAAAPAGAGAAQQVWEVNTGSKTVLRIKVVWSQQKGTWTLANVPLP